MKTLLKKIVNDEDLKASGFNFTTAYLAGKFASMASSALFGWNINVYNSIDHFAVGVGIGTLAYRKTYKKTGSVSKGVLAGLAVATIFNGVWEGIEKIVNPYNNPESVINTISDVAVVYAGSTLSFLGEKFKNYLNKGDKETK
jgi:hypothetical protein